MCEAREKARAMVVAWREEREAERNEPDDDTKHQQQREPMSLNIALLALSKRKSPKRRPRV